jgi:hypothetical protein
MGDESMHEMESPGPSIVDAFSLVIGGPFYRALRRMKLVEPAPNIRGRIVALMMMTWVPLAALSALQGTLLGHKVRLPLLYDFSIYGRFFVGLPLLIIAEIAIDPWIRRVVTAFNTTGIIRLADLPLYHSALKKVLDHRDSGMAEFFLSVLASLPLFLLDDREWITSGLTTWHGTSSGGLSPAGWWFALVSSPVVRFLLFRWLWRYLLWGILLFRVMKLDLKLIPTFPDLLGGLGFVLNAQRHFGILFAAIGGVIAGQYGNSIAYFGMPLAATEVPMVAFIVIALMVVLCPLTLLTPKLIQVRRSGLSRYSQVARNLTESFDAKWAQDAGATQGSMLGSTDPSSLIDYVNSYGVIRAIKVFPIDKHAVFQVAAEAGAPLAIVWIVATPAERVIIGLFKMLV